MGGAAARPFAWAAVVGAGEAALVVAALAIAAAVAIATTATELSHLFNANLVPGEIAAEGILRTDAGLESGIIAARGFLNFATTARTTAGTAVFRATRAILAGLAGGIATFRSHATATATAHAFYFPGADAIPFGFATVGIFRTNAAFHCRVVASRGAIVGAAITIAAAPATVFRATRAIFVHGAVAVTAGVGSAAVAPIPGTGAVAVVPSSWVFA